MAGTSLTSVFVGRHLELAKLHQALEDAQQGRGQLLLLVGEPGIGKTRLSEELAVSARQKQVRVFLGRCWEGDGMPAFWPWVQIVRAYLQHCDITTLPVELRPSVAAIAQVIPELRDRMPGLPTLSELPPDQTRFRFFDSFTLFLKQTATQQPSLLILDDLHWADTPSLLLLQFLARELSDMPVLVLGTYRDTEVSHGHPLSTALGSLARNSQQLLLRGLTAGEVGQFIAETTGFTGSETLVSSLHHQTEGNPFFVSEIVRLLETEGQLTAPASVSLPVIRVPHGVRDTIRRRLSRLSAISQQLLAVAAVIGRDFDVGLLVACCQSHLHLTSAGVLAALQEALAAHIVNQSPEQETQYRFVHALIRETLCEDLPLPQRTELHRHVGETMEQVYGAYLHLHLAALADHFFQATLGGSSEKALHYAVQAGERASALLAYEEAVVHYERAVRLLDTTEAASVRRCELLLALGDAQTRAGETKKARTTYLQAADIVRTLHAHGEPRAAGFVASAALGMAARTDVVTRFDQVLTDLLEEALRVLPEADSAVRVRLCGCLATVLYFSPAHERRAALCQHALAMARRLGDPPTLAFSLYANHFALQGPDNLEDRLAIASEIIRLAEKAGTKEIAIGGHFWRLLDLLEIGDREAFDLEVQIYLQLVEELRQPSYRWRAAILRATRALLEGHLAEGEQLVQEAFTLGQQAQSPNAFLSFASQIFGLRKEQGRLAELEDALMNFVERYPGIPALRSGLALVFSELGKTEEARLVFASLATTDFTIFPRDGNWLNAMDELSQVCAFLGDRQRAAQLYALLLPYAHRTIVVSFAEGCNGSVSRHLGILATTLGRWDDAERHFTDALAANTRLRARPFVAHTQYDYACLLLARGASGDNEQAVTFFDQALTTARELGMVRLEEKVKNQKSKIKSQKSKVETQSSVLSPQTLDAGHQTLDFVRQSPTPSTQHPAPNTFRREGDNWAVSYESLTVRLRDAKGFRHLVTLLREPGREFHVVDLLATTDHEPATTHAQSLIPDASVSTLAAASAAPDHQARTSYRQRLADLRDQLAEAERFNDAGRMATLRSESEFLTQELSTMYGVSQHARKSSTEVEKARKAVAYRIRSALTRLKKAHPVLWRHLHLTIKTGVFCSYNPEKPTDWQM